MQYVAVVVASEAWRRLRSPALAIAHGDSGFSEFLQFPNTALYTLGRVQTSRL